MNIFIGELIGTLLLILLGNGVVANVLLTRSKGFGGGWIVISAGWAFGVAIAVYSVGWISGAHLNPAVTIGLIVAGKTSMALFPVYVSGQMLGAMIGAGLVWLSYLPHFAATQDADSKLVCFCTKPAIRNYPANILVEIIATAVLLIGVLSVIDKHNGIGMGLGPFIIGILIYAIGLSLGGPTGYAINPARDLGPRIMHALLPIKDKGSSDWSYAWVPILGPIIGGVLGAVAYTLFIGSLAPLL
jgi:glycerol uptake facilitator protein